MTTTESVPGPITPHGGALVDLLVSPERAEELREASRDWPSWDLTDRRMCDLELLMNGGFSPLTGFMTRADHDAVCSDMRLADGTLWPMPITLDVSDLFAAEVSEGDRVALRDPEGVMLAVLHVEDIWRPDVEAECEAVWGTADPSHPGVAERLERTHPVCLGGRVEGLRPVQFHDFRDLRHSPLELRHMFADAGHERVVAFQTRNPMHRAHLEITRLAAREADAHLLVHPVTGPTRPGDVDHFTRVRCYRALMGRYPEGSATLSLLPLAMRMAGPREALWHALIRRNYGATHLVVGRDHAGAGGPHGPYDAQELVREHEEEAGVTMVPFRMMHYVPGRDAYVPDDEISEGEEAVSLSGTELRERLSAGDPLPEWFTYPEVAAELRRTHPPRERQGFTILFTGLSGAGKSTIANVLVVKLQEIGGRPVTLLDGDIVRRNLSSELGFSKEHRDLNIRRIGFVASEITKNGGIAVCAPIAPYDAVRREVRELIEPLGGFCLVHVATPLETCERRDRKGLYAKARAGQITGFTGIDDPYEEPSTAEVVLDTTDTTPEQCAAAVLDHLRAEGRLPD